MLHVRLVFYCFIWSCVDSRAQYRASFSAVVLLDVVLYMYLNIYIYIAGCVSSVVLFL